MLKLIDKYTQETKIHVERVAEMASQYGEDYREIALLHDILEDTDTTEDEIPEEYREDVITLTRKDTETYFEYILRVSEGSDRAVTVKLLDLKDHLDNKDTLKESLEKRYIRAEKILRKYHNDLITFFKKSQKS